MVYYSVFTYVRLNYVGLACMLLFT